MIWLIGNKGMLGTELSNLLESKKLPFVGTDREVDITSEASLADFARSLKEKGTPIAWIVNCAAYTAVDKAEDDRELCRALNEEGIRNVARVARKNGAKLLHVSTDYVFHGDGTRPYREDDPTDPTGYYGLTKRDGERAALAENPDTWIVRTAWLYGRHGNNFVFTMLRLMKEKEAISVVNDQRGTPTWAFDLADAMVRLIAAGSLDPADNKRAAPGIYHFSNFGNIVWHDFAAEIYTQGRALGLLAKDCEIKPCTSAEFPAKVRRPPYSVLDKAKIAAALTAADPAYRIPDWKESLASFLAKIEK